MSAPLPLAVERYLRTRGVQGPWSVAGTERNDFAGAVVIPALGEGESLFATLESLTANPAELRERFLVLVVINQRQDAEPHLKERNRRDLEQLSAGGHPPGLSLAWVDAASPGRELPAKDGGVGLARKLGCDLALGRLDWRSAEPLLVSLDADTLVDCDYLPALVRHFAAAREGGAVLPFRHRPAETPTQQAAIARYELFLRHYVLGLALAGSPYAFHTIGSALACTAAAYVRAGGMNRRRAGEDFYFLQQLARTAGVARLQGTIVHPSPRTSRRTPFGTGPSVGRLLDGEKDAVRFYRPETFRLLGDWLELAATGWQEPGETILGRARRRCRHLGAYLDGLGFAAAWGKLQRNHPGHAPFLAAFHSWFDALRTVRLIHHLCAGPLPKTGPEEALPPLLQWVDLEPATDLEHQLALLRRLQGA